MNALKELAPKNIFTNACLTAVIVILTVTLYPVIKAMPWGFIEDDGFFYAKIAYNIGTLGHLSFDGLNETSGFHLLWGGALGSISTLLAWFSVDRDIHLISYLIFQLMSTIFILRVYSPKWWALLPLLVLMLWGTLLMETALLALLCIGLIYHGKRVVERTAKPLETYIFLTICALIPLVRIDASIIVGGVLLALLWPSYNRIFPKALGLLLLGIATHFTLMQMLFGQWFSVSSLIKAEKTSGLTLGFNLLGHGFSYTIRAMTFFILAAAALYFATKSYQRTKQGLALGVIIGIVAFTMIHMNVNIMRSWYYIPAHMALAWYVLTEAEVRTRRDFWLHRSTIALLCGVLLLFISVKVHRYERDRNDRHYSEAFVEKVNAILPSSNKIFQVDGSGYTGYFLNANVINGDGLVNSYTYAERLRLGEMATYLADSEICYIITNHPPASSTLVQLGDLLVTTEDVTTLIQPDTPPNYYYTYFRLHRLNALRCKELQ